MSSDPNKKSPRTFQCRDMLWETFEQMARELECSVDYLINEAMKQYARQRSYGKARRADRALFDGVDEAAGEPRHRHDPRLARIIPVERIVLDRDRRERRVRSAGVANVKPRM